MPKAIKHAPVGHSFTATWLQRLLLLLLRTQRNATSQHLHNRRLPCDPGGLQEAGTALRWVVKHGSVNAELVLSKQVVLRRGPWEQLHITVQVLHALGAASTVGLAGRLLSNNLHLSPKVPWLEVDRGPVVVFDPGRMGRSCPSSFTTARPQCAAWGCI